MDLADRLRHLAAQLTGLAGDVELEPAPSPAGSHDNAVPVVERFLDVVDTGHLADLDAIVHADVVYVVPGHSRAAGRYDGPGAMRRAMEVLPRTGITDLRSKLTELIGSATTVVTFHELTGTIDGTERTAELALRFTVRDGRIAQITEYNAHQHLTDDLFT